MYLLSLGRMDLPRTETAHDHDDPEMALLLHGVHLVQVGQSMAEECNRLQVSGKSKLRTRCLTISASQARAHHAE